MLIISYYIGGGVEFFESFHLIFLRHVLWCPFLWGLWLGGDVGLVESRCFVDILPWSSSLAAGELKEMDRLTLEKT